MRHKQGFTLLELLLVCAIIGILTGVGVLNLRYAIDQSRLRDGSSQFAAALLRARSSAQRYNKDSILTLNGTTSTTYKLQINGQTSDQATTYALPAGVEITATSTAATTIRYSAPFGEVPNATPTQYTIGLIGKSSKLYIKLLGVTGKVYQSATSN